jgi:carbon storage regulator
MLVLSRKLGEKIVVPQCGLSVAVLGIQGNKVRLGISAPPEIAVHREEVANAIEDRRHGEANVDQDFWNALAADLSDAAYQTALRHRSVDSWMNLELDVSQALATTIDRWKQKLEPVATPSPTRPAQSVRLPR